MKKVLQVLTWGDFDTSHTIGICKTQEKAEKVIMEYAKLFNRNPNIQHTDVIDNSFKDMSNDSLNSFDFWIKEIKLNTIL